MRQALILIPFLRSMLRPLLGALAAVAGLILVEGAVLMRLGYDWGYLLVRDPYRAIHPIDFAVCDGGRKGLCLVRAVPRDPGDYYRHRIVVHDLVSATAPVQVPWPQPEIRVVVAIGHTSLGLVGCASGDLYQLDTASPHTPPQFFGRHEPGYLDSLACSADGRYVLSLGGKCLCVWEVASRKVIWRRTDVPFSCAVFHPHSLHMAAGLPDGAIVQIDALSGATLKSIASIDRLVFESEFSSDGQSLLAISETTLALLDWQTGAARWSRPHRSSRIALSPAGDWVASYRFAFDQGPLVLLFDAQTGKQAAAMTGHRYLILGVKFSPDGLLYSWSLDGTIRQWNAAEARQTQSLAAFNLTQA